MSNFYRIGPKLGADQGVRGKIAAAAAKLASPLVRKSDPGTFTITFAAWVACSLALTAQSARIPAWSDAHYERFTPQAFTHFAPAARVLDRNAVDHNLLDAAVFYATNAARVVVLPQPVAPVIRTSP